MSIAINKEDIVGNRDYATLDEWIDSGRIIRASEKNNYVLVDNDWYYHFNSTELYDELCDDSKVAALFSVEVEEDNYEDIIIFNSINAGKLISITELIYQTTAPQYFVGERKILAEVLNVEVNENQRQILTLKVLNATGTNANDVLDKVVVRKGYNHYDVLNKGVIPIIDDEEGKVQAYLKECSFATAAEWLKRDRAVCREEASFYCMLSNGMKLYHIDATEPLYTIVQMDRQNNYTGLNLFLIDGAKPAKRTNDNNGLATAYYRESDFKF